VDGEVVDLYDMAEQRRHDPRCPIHGVIAQRIAQLRREVWAGIIGLALALGHLLSLIKGMLE
jgi:hypothetical protein